MPLLKLPNESIIQIVLAIQDVPTLLCVTLTCKDLRIIAEPCLYSYIVFLHGTGVRLLEDSLNASPRRRTYIRELELRYSVLNFDAETPPAIDLCTLSNLKMCVSESPFCNSSSWQAREASWIAEMQSYMKCFEHASLLSVPKGLQRPLCKLRSR